MNTQPIPFGVIGAGWRAEFFVRIAQALPEHFRLVGVAVRDPAKRAEFAGRTQAPTVADVDALARLKPAFVVVSVPWEASPEVLCALVDRGLPALGETPPAPDHEALLALWARLGPSAPVQVAEQYPFQPTHAARIALVEAGLLGAVSQVQVSAAHGYHGMVLLRRLLGIGFETARVRAMTFRSPVVGGPSRQGPPKEETTREAEQTLAWLEFDGGKLGVFDFTNVQYHTWVRSNRVLVRGERGEISNLAVRRVEAFDTPLRGELQRWDTGQDGNLEGHAHRGITLGDRWLYRNPFPGARLHDDEIAVATCLERMRVFVETGQPFYGLAEASQDHYLGLCIDQAAETGGIVTAAVQPWAATP